MEINAHEIFETVFPQEEILSKYAGRVSYTFTQRYSGMRFPFKKHYRTIALVNSDIIIGDEHILISMKKRAKLGLILYSAFLVLSITGIVYYLVRTQNWLTLILSSVYLLFFILFGLIYYYLVTRAGVSFYLLKREWLDQSDITKGIAVLSGTVPAGEPYTLAQYVSKNNISIDKLQFSGLSWLGVVYPLPFVESDFEFRLLR